MVSSPAARRARWLVPFVVAGVIGLVALVPTLAAGAGPDLPAITAEQLIQKVQQSNVTAFSGRVELRTNLGIPNLGSVQSAVGGSSTGFNAFDLLSGVHSADIKVDGPERQRLTMQDSLAETAVYHNGRDVWTWQSQGQKVTHVVLPAEQADQPQSGTSTEPVPTPDQLAKQFLDAITPSTTVSVATPDYVAGQAVYELVLAPNDATSTVDHVGIAVDADSGMPLQVTVAAKGQAKPAVELGFTSVSYGTPSGSFTFTPPAGATVTTKDSSRPDTDGTNGDNGYVRHDAMDPTFGGVPAPGAPGQSTQVVGQDWGQVVIANNVNLPRGTWALLRNAETVTGSFGSARLVQTNLVNVLFLGDGRVAAGFVTPEALQAALGG